MRLMLLNKNLKEKFETMFHYKNELKVMSGGAMKIKLLENVFIKPIHINTPRQTAYSIVPNKRRAYDLLTFRIFPGPMALFGCLHLLNS